MQCVYLYYPVLKQHIQYDFEPCDNDTIDRITADHPNVISILSQEARRWATRVQRETFNTRENQKKIAALNALRESGQKVRLPTTPTRWLNTKRVEYGEWQALFRSNLLLAIAASGELKKKSHSVLTGIGPVQHLPVVTNRCG